MAVAADFSALCADRAAIEGVYYQHRLGNKPPFEETLPHAALEKLVRKDLKQEAVLKQHYGVEISRTQLDAEVRRINTTTRAPDMLAEIKTALGNDPTRFGESFAKPALVERELRQRYENDDALHAAVRRECEQARSELLTARSNQANAAQLLACLYRAHSNQVTQITWQLGPRPEDKAATPSADELEIKKRFGPDARLLSSGADTDRKFYFEDLPGELRNVLSAQLRTGGDVSAVIETPSCFLLYLAQEKTPSAMSVAALYLPKRNYEAWLAEQTTVVP